MQHAKCSSVRATSSRNSLDMLDLIIAKYGGKHGETISKHLQCHPQCVLNSLEGDLSKQRWDEHPEHATRPFSSLAAQSDGENTWTFLTRPAQPRLSFTDSNLISFTDVFGPHALVSTASWCSPRGVDRCASSRMRPWNAIPEPHRDWCQRTSCRLAVCAVNGER